MENNTEEENEVKTAVYFTEEELQDLLNCVKHKLSYSTHPDYHALKHRLKEVIDNFDVVTYPPTFQIHFDELVVYQKEKDGLSLDSKIGKKCSVWCTKYDDDHGWVTKEIDKKTTIFKGIYNNNYVVEFSYPRSYPVQEDSKIEHRVLYIPMGDVMLSFNKEDL